ncbi:phosphotransferase family protein [Nocardiopsis changdeensis]|uniref:phosphotransferase family protein n=1 Tax=Nocardiopsis changdeensis TaxID=2831969 RepID=UPI003F445DF2
MTAPVHRSTPLSGGTYNTVHLLAHTDGTETVLKTEPPAAQPRLSYEHRLLHTEARFYTLARPLLGALLPDPLRLESLPGAPERYRLLLTRLPGVPLEEVRAGLSPTGLAAVRRALGGAVAELHTLTGTGFGYPDRPALAAAAWPDAFAAMVGALLADADRTGVALPWGPDRIRGAVDGHRGLLGAVDTPVLVHFDLWDGNILVDGAPDAPALSGIIDAERAFFGDPAADLVSLALFGDIREDTAFLDGYREAGGTLEFTPDLLRRLALYRVYLHLIMYIEPATRGVPADRADRLRAFLRPLLDADLAALSRPLP